jgi:CBS domain-containing protein
MLTVRDVMTDAVVSVHPSTPLREVARLLVEHRISGVPVVADDGQVVGIVSEADFLVKEQGAKAVQHRRFARLIGDSAAFNAQQAKLAARTAGEAMTSPAITASPAMSTSQAARAMTARSVNRLPVVDGGRLVGMVTRADLVRAFVRSDAQLEATIRDEVLLHILWLDPAQFEVVVHDGVATIRGRVERRSTAEMIESAIGMVPGVVAVQSEVHWALDDSRIQPAAPDPVFPYSPH